MNINKTKILKIILYLGAVYYIIGAIAHFFGLTIFPFYDGALYTPYHDTVISLVAIVLSMVLYTVARNPEKNIDIINVMIIGGIIAIIFSIGVVWKIDFVSLGAPAKKGQTIVEAILLTMYVILLIIFKPNHSNKL
ncbi:MAG: hypothetical protein WC606_04530 [Candidatus Absconditabacterales bacterium]|jgi:hypothetical protein